MANTHSASLTAGSSQYATVANAGAIHGDKITLEAWYYPTSQPGVGAWRTIASQGNGGTGTYQYNTFSLAYRNVGGVYKVIALHAKNNVADDYATVDYTLPLNKWSHLVLRYDNTNIKAFLAPEFGVHTEIATLASAQGSGSAASGIADSMTIGAQFNNTVGGYGDGYVDEVRYWNIDKTTAQMDASFMQELLGSETNLQAYYKLNNNWQDATANARHMTPSGSPTFVTAIPDWIPKGGSPLLFGGGLSIG